MSPAKESFWLDTFNEFFHLDYFRIVLLWLLFCIWVGGAIFCAVSPGIRYLDAAFMAASSCGGTGMFTVDPGRISSGGFTVLYIIMFCGGTCTFLLPRIIYRRFTYARLRPELLEFIEKEGDSQRAVAMGLVDVIKQCELVHRGLGMVTIAIIVHNVFWLLIGTFVMYAISLLYDEPKEMIERGFSQLWVNAFLTATSYFNCGFTMTSDGMYEYADKYGLYIWCSVLILAGNSASPMCLRGLVRLMHSFADYLWLDKLGLKYALDNPRLMTTHLFPSRQNLILLIIIIIMNLTQFLFFLGSELNRPEMQAYGSKGQLVGIGYFQTISTRSAGLQLIDLHDCNQGMLVVYIFFMYISSAPIVSQMHATAQHMADDGTTKNAHEDAAAAWNTFSNSFLFRHTSGLIIAILICAFAEDSLNVHDGQFFYVIFEIFSAYGNVGLSLGVPGQNFALSGAFTDVSKLTIMAVMLMGRLRGLPHHTDVVAGFRFKRVIKKILLSARKEAAECRMSASFESDGGESPAPTAERLTKSIELARDTLFTPSSPHPKKKRSWLRFRMRKTSAARDLEAIDRQPSAGPAACVDVAPAVLAPTVAAPPLEMSTRIARTPSMRISIELARDALFAPTPSAEGRRKDYLDSQSDLNSPPPRAAT